MVIALRCCSAGAGVAATLITVAIKWTLIGRYRAGEHPL